MDTRPIIAVTMGDAAGVGPEIVVKALALEEMYALCRPLVVGDAGVLAQAQQMLGLEVALNPVADVGGVSREPCQGLGVRRFLRGTNREI